MRPRSTAPRWPAVASALLATVLTGCGTGASPIASAQTAPPTVSTAPPSTEGAPDLTEPPTSTTAPAPTTPGSVVIAFAGDIHFEGALGQALRADPAGLFDGVRLVFEASDVVVVNLETAITDGGAAASKQFTFRTSPAALDALAAAGVDVIGMANNHAVDFGPVGLEDTLDAAAHSSVPVIGIGRTEGEALRPAIVDANGRRVAVIASTDVLDGNLRAAWTATEAHPGVASAKRTDQLVAAVQGVRGSVDTVVVFLHWGVETHTCPSARQRELAQRLADAGADVVVGSHAHRVQGAGFLGTTAVGYGLGNFMFGAGSAAARTTGILRVTAAGRDVSSAEWVPARIDGVGKPTVLMGAEADAARDDWLGLRQCAGLSDAPS